MHTSTFIRHHPARSLVIVALGISSTLLIPVVLGVWPSAYHQYAAFGPSLAAIVLAGVMGGRPSVERLLGRLLIWRVGLKWWLFVLISPALLAVASLTLFNVLGGPVVDYAALPALRSLIPMILMLTIVAGLGEEFGWRGFVLPHLQSRENALYASWIVGLIWGIWHVPLFFLDGTVQLEWAADIGHLPAILLYTAYLVANAIQYTWVFNHTQGSVLLVAVLHGAQNAWMGGYIDVYRGEIGGIVTLTVMAWVVAGVIILVTGSEHLSRSAIKQQTVA